MTELAADDRAAFDVIWSHEVDTTIVELRGQLDSVGATTLRIELDRIAAAGEARRLVLDMAEVDFIDSAGIGTIVAAHRTLQNDFCVLAIQDPSPIVRRALELSGIGDRIQVGETRRASVCSTRGMGRRQR